MGASEPAAVSQASPCLDLLAECWGLDEQMAKGVQRASAVQFLRHGMAAHIPIVCYREKCPYQDVCYIPPDERPQNGRCPIEVATILTLFDRYCKSLGVTEEDVVDLSLIRELVDLDVQMIRADNRLAISADFVEDVVTFVTPRGQAFTAPQLTKAVEYKDRIRRERHRILQLLNSTRKDREGGRNQADPSTYAAALLARARELERSSQARMVIDVETEQETPAKGDD